MQHSESIDSISAALAKAQGEIKGAVKDSTNPHFKSKYADLASVWDACRAALSKNGLAVFQTTETTADGVFLITTLAHSSGQWVRGTMPVQPVQNTPQGLGSALTYGRRYSLAAMVGVAPEDDDGNAASEGTPKPNGATRTAAPVQSAEPWKADAERIKQAIDAAPDEKTLDDLIAVQEKPLAEIKKHSASAHGFLVDRAAKRRAALAQRAA